MAILGGYPINQIAHAEWDLFRTTLLNTRTRYGIRKQMAVEDALKYKVEMRRLKRQSKSEDGGNRYSSRPRNGAEIAHEDVELPFVSADRVKRLKAYCQNLFDAAANKGYGPNRWADIKYVPNKDEDRERTGRRFFEEDEENPSDLRLTSDEARGFIANGVTVPQRMAILQEVFSCRGGEGMGSTWGQLRELNGRYILAITHQVREENNKPIRTARLKTTRSKREVLASKSDADLIALLGPRGRDSDFIITNSEKLPVPRVVQEEYFVALMNAGLTHRPDRRDATPHAFRSHCISKWLNQEKREAIQVMQWAGHSKLDTTVKYYLESNWKEMARKMIDNDSS
jgi:integrase